MKKRFLRDIAEIQTGPFGSQLHKEDYVDVGTPIVTVEHLGSRVFSEQNLPMVSDTDKRRLSKYILNKGDIVFSRVGSVDRCSFVDQKHDGWMFSGRCLRVRPSEKVDSMFLYYFFCLNTTKEFVRSIAVGATMPSINTKLLGDVEVVCPEIEEQRKIADILSKIDDKIEENLKINENLLEQATALFDNALQQSESVSFVELSSLADVKGGKRLPKGVNLITKPNSHPYIRVRNLNNMIFASLSSDYEYVDDETQKSIARYITSAGDVLVSIVGTIGLTAIVDDTLDNANLTENCVKLTNLKGITPEYLLLFLRSKIGVESINKGTVGAVQLKLPIKNIQSIPVPLLMSVEMQAFSDILSIMFNRISSNIIETKRLSELRDVLLPKLMSGELDVSAIDL